MQNIFIEFLPPWIETGLQPAFYDKESGTILQQVSRMYAKMNELISAINGQNKVIDEYIQKFYELREYVDDYFDDLNVQTEINNKLDDMAEDGTLAEIINQQIFGELNTKLSTVINIDTKFAQNLLSGTAQTVLFAGDSLTYGENPNSGSQVANPFPSLVQSFIRNWFEDNSIITCLNYGVGGARSAYANSHFDTYLAQNPSTIFWQYGTNDISNNVPIETTLDNLNTFYTSCVTNNIELIVIISPQNYGNTTRQRGLRFLHDALVTYCESRGIPYVDMFEYVYNLYKSGSTNHTELQTDNTHFVDYTCFRDAIVTKLLPIAYEQESSKFSYIGVGHNTDYINTNIGRNVPTDNIDDFGDALIMNDTSEYYFKMNFHLKSRSILYLNGYDRTSAGKAVFTLDGNDYEVVETTSQSDAGNDRKNIGKHQIGTVLGAGLHTITLKNLVFATGQTRFYLFGFTLEEADTPIAQIGQRQLQRSCLAWTGSSSSLSNEDFNLDIKKFNRITLVIGSASDLQTIDLRNVEAYNIFTNADNNSYTIPTNYNGTAGVATFSISPSTNKFSYSTTETAPLRRIWFSYDNSWFENPINYS